MGRSSLNKERLANTNIWFSRKPTKSVDVGIRVQIALIDTIPLIDKVIVHSWISQGR